MTVDEKYMLRCLELAELGLGEASPNPSVGCVIVVDHTIIGEGFTSPYGGNHAEVNAINSVENKDLLTKATVYVSLEPCAHFGKTPPCADLLVNSKVKRMVIGCQDPFSKVNGAGIAKLQEAGIEVVLGVLEEECKDSNRRFFTFHKYKRPYIILKWAETQDGFVDHLRTNDIQKPLRITCNTSSMLVHKWRTEESAILIGKNTLTKDNPELSARKYQGRNPIRVLLGADAVYESYNLFNKEVQTMVITQSGRDFKNTETIQVDDTKNLKSVFNALYERNVLSVLVEGGPTVHKWFYQNHGWDEIRRFVAPINIYSGIKAMVIKEEPNEAHCVGTDQLFVYRRK